MEALMNDTGDAMVVVHESVVGAKVGAKLATKLATKKRVKEEVVECIICVEPMNKSTRKPVKCEWCDFVACRACCEHRVLDLPEPKCMDEKCGKTWSRKHMARSFTGVFMSTRFKAHREQLEFDKEKALLPATQERMMVMRENMAEAARLLEEHSAIQKMFKSVLEQKSWREARWTCKLGRLQAKAEKEGVPLKEFLAGVPGLAEAKSEFDAKQGELNRQRMSLALESDHLMARIRELRSGRADPSDNSGRRRKALRTCPADGCRGFLDENWECGLCAVHVCASCRVPITDGHSCNPDDVESARAIDKETRGCPKCATAIFKIDGCDQMWCTQCHTAFSWRTGAVEVKVHNPHFFEWLRKSGGAQRALGDVQCGREIDDLFGHALQQELRRVGATAPSLFRHVQRVSHLRWGTLPTLTRTATDDQRFKLRESFLLNEVCESVFRARVLSRECTEERKREQAQVVDMVINAATDILFRALAALRAMPHATMRMNLQEAVHSLCLKCEAELRELSEHARECMQEIARTFKTTVINVSV